MAAIDPKLLGEDYQKERYIPKGFRTGEYVEGEKIYSQKEKPENYFVSESEGNEHAITLWFSPNQPKSENGIQSCTSVSIGETTYNFTHEPLEVQTKMDVNSRRNFRRVLEGFKKGVVLEFELRNTAKNPSDLLPAREVNTKDRAKVEIKFNTEAWTQALQKMSLAFQNMAEAMDEFKKAMEADSE